METETTTTNKKENVAQMIVEKYQEYILLNGHEPPSIYAFCKDIGIEEGDFYDHFNDFNQLASAFWLDSFYSVKDAMTSDSEFASFSVREKLLSFYYGYFEKLKKNRSYALLSFKGITSILNREAQQLNPLKKEYKSWASELVAEGIGSNEIAGRSKISETYDNLFWLQFLFLLNFWMKDDSRGFEKTDAAIEKSVHFGFDLIEKNALDSAIDFGKFLFQNR